MEIKTKDMDNNNPLRILLDASFQGVKRLFVLAFDNTENGAKNVARNSHQNFFPRSKYNQSPNYNVLIDGRIFYNWQLIQKT